MSSLLDALIAAEEFPPLKGDRGPKGDVGDKGDKGDTGYQGLEGPTGPMGPDGPVGPGGPEGPEGKRGPKGLKGDDGEKGDKGDEGPAGRDGGVAGGRSYNVRGFASGMVIDDEGTKLNSGAVVGEIDFVGSGVSTAIVGSKAVVTVAGGSGLPSGGTVGQVVTNTGPGAGDWDDPSAGFPDATGAGAPVSNPTTHPVGYSYIDTTNGALYMVADIIGTLEWVMVGGEINGAMTIPGVVLGSGFAFVGKSINGAQAVISDIDAYNNSGNGVGWFGTGTDGGQRLRVRVGAPGSPLEMILFADGELDVPGLLYSAGKIVSDDVLVLGGNAAPASGDLSAGQVSVWFDKTNGAASPKWKGKQADGTVVSGSLGGGGGSGSFLSIAKWT